MTLHRQRMTVTLTSAIVFIFLLNLVFLYYSIGDRVWLFYNSDSLYLPYLYQDLITRHGKFSEWIFASTPYFFPDTLIYFILATISQNLKLSILLYSIVQFTLYYWLIIAIGKKIIKNTEDVSLFHLSVLVSLLFLSKGYLQQETLMMGLISQSHFGTALMFLLGLLLILNTFSSQSPWNYVFLFTVCFLTVFSDILYLTQFFAPVILSLWIMRTLSNNLQIKKIYTKNICIVSLGCISSYLLYRSNLLPLHLDKYTNGLRRIYLNELWEGVKKIAHDFWVFYQSNAIIFVFLCFYIVLTLHYLTKRFVPTQKNQADLYNNFNFIIIFLFTSIMLGILSLLFADNNLMVKNFINLRHCIPFIIFPVFLGIPLFFAMYTSFGESLSKYYLYLMLAMLAYAYLFIPQGGSIANIIRFYPDSIACLDSYANKYHLKNGISYHYWETRSNSFLSKKDLNIVNVKSDLSVGPTPRLYFNTMNDFKNKDFNFILFNNDHLVDPKFVANVGKFKKIYGTPSAEFTCPSWNNKKNTVYVYQSKRLNKNWDDRFFEKLVKTI